MKMLIEITTYDVEQLLKCKRRIKDRDFRGYNVSNLLNEAIFNFVEKYGEDSVTNSQDKIKKTNKQK